MCPHRSARAARRHAQFEHAPDAKRGRLLAPAPRHACAEALVVGVAAEDHPGATEQRRPVDGDRVLAVLDLALAGLAVTTVGYGDVNPSNTKERIFVIVVMMVGVVSFSFIAGSLTTLVQDYDTILSENK